MSYVSLVTDAYSRKIVGHHVHESLRSEDVEQALRKALFQRLGSVPLIHHSDQGIQYCCDSYQKIYREHGIQCSMTDGYDCYQNALAERVNGILKTEFLLAQPGDINQARTMVNESVEIYNGKRPHLALK
jgi:transposase InsO family protein